MLKESEKTITRLQKSLDIVIITASWLGAYALRFKYIPNAESGLFLEFFKVGLVLAFISYFIFERYQLYTSYRFSSRFAEIMNSIKANFTSFVALVFFLYFLKLEKISRIHLGVYLFLSSFGLIFARIFVRKILKSLRKKGKNLRHVLLVGTGDNITDYIEAVRKSRDSGISFLGWIDSNGAHEKYNIPKIELSYQEFIKEKTPDNVVVSYGPENSKKLSDFIKENYNDLISIQVLPDLSYSLVGHSIEDFLGIPLLTLNEPNVSILEYYLKAFIDFTASLLTIILISPLLFIVAILTKLSSPGPIFYFQERVGLGGKKFKMWKFRSMRVASNDEDKVTWSSKDDPRKTKFGSLIRSTSIDELPQLWNVLKGDMSLIGPRPERPFFVDKFKNEIPNYMLRHKMKAGITGWAQVNGWRGDTSLEKRIECDIYYIKNWSILLDIKIVFLTIIKGFVNKNAY
ncbi:undecaprenyl-phosphate glucose phosphotransferase [Halobacteriovorax marinus]|uniref:Undecaprenyl-phosphate glucose phosphotransferase n=1 Tax=Halobacteriovorax marinus TaxID=97084 RepID=A0A1Y5FAS7_9BACT|nr:undecaprenyl-phosphate glucose phosphotransferase [Halobacteriovorax marinus]